MDVVHDVCAGLDLHKRSIMACVLRGGRGGRKSVANIRQFGTTTTAILSLGDWLQSEGVRHVAMESTGVFWKPVWNLLEGTFDLMLCNARHMKQVPGRKTDVQDCQWIAQLLQHGLLKASFVPPRPMRELRELTRMRVQFTEERTRVISRVEKVLEDANIKLGAVVSNMTGKSARTMLEAMVAGETDAEILTELAQGRLKRKKSQLREALSGGVTEHHRFLLGLYLEQLTTVETSILRIDDRINSLGNSDDGEMGGGRPFREARAIVDTAPGVSQVGSDAILAEIGTDMSRFESAANLASWSGICPGNNESAGKRSPARPIEATAGCVEFWFSARGAPCARRTAT